MKEFNAVITIAYRDLMKLLRDRTRLITSLIFPFIFIGILGGSLQAGLGASVGINLLTFTFTGVLAQTLFMSASQGVISLIDDRENDFSQEIFVAPISRYTIVFGKILGETLVALVQGLGILVFGLVLGIQFSLELFVAMAPIVVIVCLFGGAFGVVILANLGTRRAADQIFNFIMLPQYFLAGVFNPIQNLPWYLDILSKLSPLRYAVDLARGVFYAGSPDYRVVLASPLVNLAIIAAEFAGFLIFGTVLFVRRERNR
ncbi:MAG: ABC transporter permease [Chloroflexi bacterium]|nr:ABC transporter permease [Chloroflexota bacterium]